MLCTARMYLSHTGDRYILALAPMKPKGKAPKHNGDGLHPVDTAFPVVQPGPENGHQRKGKQRGRHRLMHTQCGEDNNGGDEEDASHAGTPAKEPHHNGKQCKKKCSHTPYSPPYDFSLAGDS